MSADAMSAATMSDTPMQNAAHKHHMSNYMEPRTAKGLCLLALVVVIIAIVWYSNRDTSHDQKPHCGRASVVTPHRKVYDRHHADDGYHSDSSSHSSSSSGHHSHHH